MNSAILIAFIGNLFQFIELIPVTNNVYQPIIAQHLGQDAYGHYSYGYITPTSTKSESKGKDGIIRGGYSYIDPKGNLQSVHYAADPIRGFLVAASNLPQDVPNVAYAKQRHLQKYEAIKAEHAALAFSKQIPQIIPGIAPDISSLPQDVPAVAYAKQRHLDNYEAIKAQHAAIALAKQDPHADVVVLSPIRELPAVAKARAQHLAAFEAVRARDLALKAAKDETEETVPGSPVYSYIPIVPTGTNDEDYHSYGYIHPIGFDDTPAHGYSYMDTRGVINTINYMTN